MFKQLSNRVSAKTIEETYTDLDVEHVKDADGKDTTDISLNYNPNTGFTFDYPQRWLNEENEFKAIGIRRLKVIPTSHIFALLVRVEYMLLGSSEAYETNDRAICALKTLLAIAPGIPGAAFLYPNNQTSFLLTSFLVCFPLGWSCFLPPAEPLLNLCQAT